MRLTKQMVVDPIHMLLALFTFQYALACDELPQVDPFSDENRIIHVNGTTGDDNNDGYRWDSAKKTIQKGIDSAGCEVWVAKGTYKTSDRNERSDVFKLKSGIKVYGGFSGEETKREQRDFRKNVTVLDGNIGDPELQSDNAYHVVVIVDDGTSREDGGTYTGPGDTRLDGFVITGGNANDIGFLGYGGGMLNRGNDSLVVNCTFEHNSSIIAGGGLYNGHDASTDIVNCIFRNNMSSENGGGVYNHWNSTTHITNSLFYSNTADGLGGAMHDEITTETKVSSCTFTNNQANTGGGAISAVSRDSTAVMAYNSIIWDNGPDQIYAIDLNDNPAYLNASSCFVKKDDNVNSGVGVLDKDNPGLDKDFQLSSTSRCIGSGDQAVLPKDIADLDGDGKIDETLPVDLGGRNRIAGSIVDIGAYEHQY
ncbi:MAG: hypothetical protein GY847_14710 [Proteobacteria bacterium]|nr:hypothetical protein [Pseudomonadota bacterium]